MNLAVSTAPYWSALWEFSIQIFLVSFCFISTTECASTRDSIWWFKFSLTIALQHSRHYLFSHLIASVSHWSLDIIMFDLANFLKALLIKSYTFVLFLCTSSSIAADTQMVWSDGMVWIALFRTYFAFSYVSNLAKANHRSVDSGTH